MQPFQGRWGYLGAFPRVGPLWGQRTAVQPWAELCNPFGIVEGLMRLSYSQQALVRRCGSQIPNLAPCLSQSDFSRLVSAVRPTGQSHCRAPAHASEHRPRVPLHPAGSEAMGMSLEPKV